MPAGSFLWQTIFISFAVFLVALEIVRGWRLGVVRQLIRVAAVIVAYAAAVFGGRILVPVVRPFARMPDIILAIVLGAILALLVYSAIVTTGTILFKRTGQQKVGAVRWLYGLCGAVLGIFFGLLSVWLIVVSVRALGAIANAELRTRAAQQKSLSAARSSNHSQPAAKLEETKPIVASLAKLKDSIELGSFGDVVKSADVVPPNTYQTLGKIGTVFSNPQSAERFLNYAGAKELTENPKIIALRDDPEIMKMIEEGRYLDLLRDPRLISALNDPALLEQVRGFDFQRALDFAVGKK